MIKEEDKKQKELIKKYKSQEKFKKKVVII